MVATDIAARGIDVDRISHVINYDIPDTADAYIHRIGRTGRAEREGDAFTMITPEDDIMVRTIERAVGQRITRQTIAGFDYNAPAPAFTPSPPQRGRQPMQQQIAPAAAPVCPRRAVFAPGRTPAAIRPAGQSRRRAVIGATRANFKIACPSAHARRSFSATACVCYWQVLRIRRPSTRQSGSLSSCASRFLSSTRAKTETQVKWEVPCCRRIEHCGRQP